MQKIMIQKITQNSWNFWTVNLIMRAKKLWTSRQIFQYAVPARTVTKKALANTKKLKTGFGTPLIDPSKEMEWAPYLQPRSSHGPLNKQQ